MKILALLLLLLSCSSGRSSKETASLYSENIMPMKDISRSQEKFSTADAYEIFMNLDKDSESISIDIIQTSKISLTKERSLLSYYVLDKKINASGLSGGKIVYTEIYRNFDKDWNLYKTENIEFKNSKNPFCRLTKGEYRIRFILSDSQTYKITIKYSSNAPVSFRHYN